MKEMNSAITKIGIKTMIWYANKMFRIAFEGLFVDQKSLESVRTLVNDGYRVVLMPVYKSFADHFIQTYI